MKQLWDAPLDSGIFHTIDFIPHLKLAHPVSILVILPDQCLESGPYRSGSFSCTLWQEKWKYSGMLQVRERFWKKSSTSVCWRWKIGQWFVHLWWLMHTYAKLCLPRECVGLQSIKLEDRLGQTFDNMGCCGISHHIQTLTHFNTLTNKLTNKTSAAELLFSDSKTHSYLKHEIQQHEKHNNVVKSIASTHPCVNIVYRDICFGLFWISTRPCGGKHRVFPSCLYILYTTQTLMLAMKPILTCFTPTPPPGSCIGHHPFPL